MRIHSTCVTCNETMLVVEHGQRVHDGCVDTGDYATRLEADYIAAATAGDDTRVTELETALRMLDTATPKLARAALAYAAWGWPVFPLQPGRKDPLPGSHGCLDATTAPEMITAWWTTDPKRNVGLATGTRFDVLDVDVPAGILSWADLRDNCDSFDVHGMVTTPRGGIHAYVAASGGGNLAGFRPGLDYRGTGGYVVAPPSRLINGRNYHWSVRPSPTLTMMFSQPQAA